MRLAVRAPHAFDGEGFRPDGATVLVEDDVVVGVESAAFEIPDGWKVHEHEDATVLPGLVDTHVHLVADGGVGALDRVAGYSPAELDAVVETALRAQLAGGVTTVRDLGDRDWVVLARRDAQRAASGAADDGLPRLLTSGPPLTVPDGHCHYLGGVVDGEASIRSAIAERAERGVDVVKVMASGGLNTPRTDVAAAQFDAATLRLMVEEAHRHGLPLTAHAHARTAVALAVEAGVDGIEHASFLGRAASGLEGPLALLAVEADEADIARLAASGIPCCPTFGGFSAAMLRLAPPGLRAAIEATGRPVEELVAIRFALFERLYAAGVRLVCGMDAGISPPKAHGGYRHAVTDMARVMPAVAALASATSGAADVLGLPVGRLRPGDAADLLVVGGDLEQDLDRLADVRQVVVRGRVAELG